MIDSMANSTQSLFFSAGALAYLGSPGTKTQLFFTLYHQVLHITLYLICDNLFKTKNAKNSFSHQKYFSFWDSNHKKFIECFLQQHLQCTLPWWSQFN